MDDSFPELEAELKSLTPRRPSPRLMERLAAELSAGAEPAVPEPRYTTSTNLSSWKWVGWRTAGLAAALTLFAAVGLVSFQRLQAPAASPRSPQTAATAPVPANAAADRYQPVAATNVLYDLKDEGLVRADDNSAARQVRYRYLDTYTWKNPKSNASLKWSVPRDEIRLVSATLN